MRTDPRRGAVLGGGAVEGAGSVVPGRVPGRGVGSLASVWVACAVVLFALEVRFVLLHPWSVPVVAVLFFQLVTSCCFYALHRVREGGEPGASGWPTVDVLVTCNGEEVEQIRETVGAAAAMEGGHTTWVLDDARDPKVRQLAAELGARYLAREGDADWKAGNINAALPHLGGEIVVVFDSDHRPAPDFLVRTVGAFDDPEIGFVQNGIDFRNLDESWTARASAETATEYYNLISPGKDAVGAVTMMGSNALMRRAALDAIGGYRPGLAEDLETSLALHVHGWKSFYVAEPLAPGLTPADYVSFHRQQKKWARGVVEAAIGSLRSTFWKLDAAQKLGYALRFSYYLTGPLVLLGIAATSTSLATGIPLVEGVLLDLLPLLLCAAVVRFSALRLLAVDPRARSGVQVRGGALVFVAWPAYCAALCDAVLRRPVRFVATPKRREFRGLWALCWPHAVSGGALAIGLVAGWNAPMPVTRGFAVLQLAFHAALLGGSGVPSMLRRSAAEAWLTAWRLVVGSRTT